MEINPDDLITMSEAARIRPCSRQAIFNLVAKGRLKNIRIGGIVFVSRLEVIEFKSLPPGRKQKIKTDM